MAVDGLEQPAARHADADSLVPAGDGAK